MEGGALGVDGADAAEPVGKDHRSKNANVTVQGHKMEGGNVKDSVSSHGNVKLGIAPVSPLPYMKSFKRLNNLKKKKKQVRESEKSKLVDIDFHRFFFLREKLKVADVNFLFHEKMNLTVVLLMIKRLLIISMILIIMIIMIAIAIIITKDMDKN